MTKLDHVPGRRTASRRIVLAGIGALAAALTVPLLPLPAAAEEAPKEVRIGSFSVAVDYAPYLVARAQGWFEQALGSGTKVSYQTFQSLPPINEAFATDRIDFVFEAEPPALIGRAAGIGINIVAESAALVQEILVPAGSPAASAADLKGKKIAVLAGTSSHYGVVRLLKEAGLGPSDVEIVDLVPPDAKAAFDTGRVDAWAVWPPFVEQEEIAGKGRTLPKGDATINSILAARSGFLDSHPAAATKVVGVVQQAKAWIAAHPAEARAIVAKELGIPLAVVERAWPRHDFAAQLTPAVAEDIQEKADFLVQAGYIRNKVDVASLVRAVPTN